VPGAIRYGELIRLALLNAVVPPTTMWIVNGTTMSVKH